MKQVLTLVVKLQVTPELYKFLDDTALTFASAYHWINTHLNQNLTHKVAIQAVCYSDVKSQFGLTANPVVRVCARVAANRLKYQHKKLKFKGFQPTRFDCDGRTFHFIEDEDLASISTTGKRVKVPVRLQLRVG